MQDWTGLTGRYTMELDYRFLAPRPNDPAASPDISGPSLFTALREQWGLKLEKARGPLKVIVVDDARQPASN